MQIKPFDVERWMDLYENDCKFNLAETCVSSLSLSELMALTGMGMEFLAELASIRLTYGEIPGYRPFREGIADLYESLDGDHVLTTNGAIGANSLVLTTLVEPGDEVVVVAPTYQQHLSIPEMLGAEVKVHWLEKEHEYLPDLEKLAALVTEKTKLICINNPNNPTGSLMDLELLREIVEIARVADAYLLCDEVYRHLTQEDVFSPSVADLYEKGISTGSMSKVFSLAGLRLGWVAGPTEVIAACYEMRHYMMISCGKLDERIGALALGNADVLLERNRSIIRTNLKILDEWVKTEPRIDYIKPQAGTTALLSFDLPMSSTDLCHDLMAKEGVMFVPGDAFEMGKTLRVGYAFQPDHLRAGLLAFSRYLRNFD